jgi:hypothetical protein
MINSDMRNYNYYLLGTENSYGQAALIKDENGEPIIQGQIQMSINPITQSILDTVRYSEFTYLGLTHDKNINDTYVIEYGSEKLKVKYINNKSRFTQVFMGKYE